MAGNHNIQLTNSQVVVDEGFSGSVECLAKVCHFL